jgi:hypothetical protein
MKTVCGIVLGLSFFVSCSTSKNMIVANDSYKKEYAENIKNYIKEAKPDIYNSSGKDFIWMKDTDTFYIVKRVEKINN